MACHLFIGLLFLLLNTCVPKPGYTPLFTPSEDSLFDIKEDQIHTFGYLEVPENRKNPAGNWIKLPVYIFKSRNPNPAADPIIYTVGGPGSTTMPSAQYMAYYSYLEDRDFILFEQRGTQYAEPPLDCPEWAAAQYQANLPGFPERSTDSLLAKAAKICRDRLNNAGIDLNQYRTQAIAADIADLRKALSIEEYNLLTISYSTKIAQVLLREYPEGIRSVVMDSALPLEVQYDEESVDNLVAIINQILADCAADADCNRAYPQLKDRWWRFLQAATDQPIDLEVKHPQTGKPEIFRLRGKDFISILSAASTAEVPYIPMAIEKLLQEDYTQAKEWLQETFSPAGPGKGIGMRLSVWCAEEAPFNQGQDLKENAEKYSALKGLSGTVFSQDICQIWTVKAANPLENKAVRSEVPVLFINGSYDQETPVWWAQKMQTNFPNSHHLIFEGWRHTPTTYWNNTCAMKAAQAFFAQPFQKPEVKCQENINGVKFITN